jgi:hypothetical protein
VIIISLVKLPTEAALGKIRDVSEELRRNGLKSL